VGTEKITFFCGACAEPVDKNIPRAIKVTTVTKWQRGLPQHWQRPTQTLAHTHT